MSGRYRKDVLPLSPTRAPEPAHYHFTQVDPTPNHISKITPEKVGNGVSALHQAWPSVARWCRLRNALPASTRRQQGRTLRRRRRSMTSSSLVCMVPRGAPAPLPHTRRCCAGGGHNGLVSAAYLAKAGKKVLVLERRYGPAGVVRAADGVTRCCAWCVGSHTIGGAAVTEEMVPGFKFSRGSYLAGLFRPDIIKVYTPP